MHLLWFCVARRCNKSNQVWRSKLWKQLKLERAIGMMISLVLWDKRKYKSQSSCKEIKTRSFRAPQNPKSRRRGRIVGRHNLMQRVTWDFQTFRLSYINGVLLTTRYISKDPDQNKKVENMKKDGGKGRRKMRRVTKERRGGTTESFLSMGGQRLSRFSWAAMQKVSALHSGLSNGGRDVSLSTRFRWVEIWP